MNEMEEMEEKGAPWWALSEAQRSRRISAWATKIGPDHPNLRRLLRLRFAGVSSDERPGFAVYPINGQGAIGQVEFSANGNLLYRRKTFFADGRVTESLVR